ncbi:MAG: alpha/beta hydrolase [Maricaulaceae bacterium]|jgi:pimeloyl-ACP methyl ester carboxylesterase
MLKWLLRIVCGLIAVVVVAVGGAFVAFSIWKGGHVRALEADSQVIETARGPVEYADVGQGTPRLMIHGTPGGYDQGLIAWRVRPESYEDVRFISVSRPGYLRTPIESGRTPAEQADLYAALLDELEIERAVVYAGSGGAPSGLQFALRHPERVEGLLLVVPVLTPIGEPGGGPSPGATTMLMSDLASWAMGANLVASLTPDYDPEDPLQAASAAEMVRTVVPMNRRTEGWANDRVELARLDVAGWPLEDLAVPTLILHGNADENAPYEGSLAAAARIPNAELVTYEGGNHYIVLTRAPELNAEVERFLDELE